MPQGRRARWPLQLRRMPGSAPVRPGLPFAAERTAAACGSPMYSPPDTRASALATSGHMAAFFLAIASLAVSA